MTDIRACKAWAIAGPDGSIDAKSVRQWERESWKAVTGDQPEDVFQGRCAHLTKIGFRAIPVTLSPADAEPTDEAPKYSKGPTPDVQAKTQNNQWDHIQSFIKVLQAMREGKWTWCSNTRCKYVELRVDMRDGGCIIRDRERTRISPEQLAYQYKGDDARGSE